MRKFKPIHLLDGIIMILIGSLLMFNINVGHFHPEAFIVGWGIGNVLTEIINILYDDDQRN